MEVDYDADPGPSVDVVQAEPANMSAKAEAEVEGLSDQAEQSLLELLEAQRSRTSLSWQSWNGSKLSE